MLREAGAAEVHLRIMSPPYRWPCFYGMDTGDRGELLAANLTVEEIRDYLGADSLAYLDLDRLRRRHRRRRRRLLHRLPHRRLPRRGAGDAAPRAVLEATTCRSRGLEPTVPPRRPSRTPVRCDLRRRRRRHRRRRRRRRAHPHVRSTHRPEVLGDIGGFGGLFALARRLPRAGARVVHRRGGHQGWLVAELAGRFDTIGIDLVAMCVDDLAVPGRRARCSSSTTSSVGVLDPP